MWGNAAREWERAIDDWTKSLRVGKSATTIRQRRWQLRQLAEAHLNRSPWKLTTGDLTEWLISHDWTEETRKSARSAVRRFYEWAVKNGRTKANPAETLDAVRVPKRLPRPAHDDALRAALDGADDRLRLMLLLAAYCGLRVSEIAGLRWADVGDEWMTVLGKGKKERRVPLVPIVATALAEERGRRAQGRLGSGFRYGQGDPSTHVFPGRRSGGMAPGWVSELLSEALGPTATAHQLRHRAAMRALHGTRDLAAVQQLLGHTDPATTKIYAHADDAALRAAVDAI